MKILSLILLTLNSLFAIVNLQPQSTLIFQTHEQTAKISLSNLTIGQSGVVVKNLPNNSIILTQATVIKSDTKESIIKFVDTKMFNQDAIPRTRITPQDGDTFVLNHLYQTSLLIVPNNQAKNSVKSLYPDQNFLDEDFFASYLKLHNTPLPKKETISQFTQEQQIGTIFIVVQNNLFIIDSLSFTVLDTLLITNNNKKAQTPFLTRIENIENGLLDFGSDTMENYDLYYLKLLEVIK